MTRTKQDLLANPHSLLWPCIVLSALLCMVAGCGRGLGTSYGKSRGYSASRSVNGFSTLRDAFENAGFKDRDLKRLTDRARSSSVVVWTPQTLSGINKKSRRWFENWLRSGNRTLIYVVPDSGSEAAFYKQAQQLASPKQRMEYRRKFAEQVIIEHRWQLARIPLAIGNWVRLEPKVQREKLIVLGQVPPGAAQSVEWVIEPYKKEQSTQTPLPNAIQMQSTGPGGLNPLSVLQAIEEDASPTDETDIRFESMIQSDSGDTLVARVTHDKWNGSQVIVVGGGGLLTNFALTREPNQKLAEQLIEQTIQNLVQGDRVDSDTMLAKDGKPPLAAFSSAVGGMPISERQGDIPRASGAELLTVFPLSLVTIHIAILGIVICLMLMPIFGRPRNIDRGVLTHFGDHLTAVAALMRRRGGESFARRRISDYMKRVRGETSGEWVLDDPKPELTGKPLTNLESTTEADR